MSIFRNNKKNVDKGFNKMDKIVTWLVLWSIVASVYGIKKHESNKRDSVKTNLPNDTKWKMSSKDIIKWIIFWVDNTKTIKKPGFFKSIFLFISHIIKESWKK